MSLLKSIRQQLGLSVTPANNFTLDASADNGTMKLARGNAGATTQDILTVGSNGSLIPNVLANYANDAAAQAGGVPVGGLYQTTGTVKVRVS